MEVNEDNTGSISRDRFARIAMWATAALLPVVVYLPPIWLSLRSFFVFPDSRDQTYAWFQKMAQCWHAGYLPLWDAETMSGRSFVGEFQTGVLYPLNWLWLALFATPDGIATGALDALMLLHFSIASVGMTLLLRTWQLGRLPALCGAAVFALLGSVALRAPAQPNIFFGLCLVPWAMLLAWRHLRDGSIPAALGAGAIVGLQILAGHVQPAIHTVVMIAAMSIGTVAGRASTRPQQLRQLAVAATLMGAAIAIVAAAQLALSLQYLHQAYRWIGADAPLPPGKSVPFKIFGYHYMMEPRDFGSLIDPWASPPRDANTLYFGTLPLLVALLLFLPKIRDRVPAWTTHGRWLLVTACFAVACMLGHNLFLAAILRKIPALGQVRELARFTIVFHFVMASLFAFALHSLQQTKLPPVRWRWTHVVFVAALVLQLGWMWAKPDGLLTREATYQLALTASLGLLVAVFPTTQRLLPALALALVVQNAVAFSVEQMGRTDPAQPMANAFELGTLGPALSSSYGHYRVLFDDGSGLSQNVANVRRIQTKGGYSATMFAPYFEFLDANWTLDSDVNDLLNVRYVVAKTELSLRLIARDAATGLNLYERERYYPRLFLRTQLGRPGAALEQEIELRTLAYDDHLQRFSIRTSSAGSIIASEIDYPGWCATVNGEPVETSRAVLPGTPPLLREVPVPAGTSVIEFRFRPFYGLIFGCK